MVIVCDGSKLSNDNEEESVIKDPKFWNFEISNTSMLKDVHSAQLSNFKEEVKYSS